MNANEFKKTIDLSREWLIRRVAFITQTREIPEDPRRFGYFVELIACIKFGYASWRDLPRAIRLELNGRKCSTDFGIDAVGEDCIVQIKWYNENSVNAHHVMVLTSLASGLKKRKVYDFITKCVFVLQKGTHISSSCPDEQLEQITVKYLSRDEVDGIISDCKKQFPITRIAPPLQQAAIAEYTKFQDECLHAVWDAADHSRYKKLIKAKLPTGVGKSYIIMDLALMCVNTLEKPVIIVAPRVIIIDELKELFNQRNIPCCSVACGFPWEDGFDIYILSGASAFRIPDGFEASVIIDEAHYELGRKNIMARVKPESIFEFSASLDQKDLAYNMKYDYAIERGFICDVRYVFAAFEKEPTFHDMAAHLLEHQEHRHVLACFHTKESAQQFVKIYNSLDGKRDALEFTSEQTDMKNLNKFREGGVRVLAVVARLEMGVNVHIIDTIMLCEPWESRARTQQICGRGCRWHWAKANYFSILQCLGPETSTEKKRLMRIHDIIQGDDVAKFRDRIEFVVGINQKEHERRNLVRNGKIKASSAGPSRGGGEDPEYFKLIQRNVYDRFMKTVDLSANDRLRFEYDYDRLLVQTLGCKSPGDYFAKCKTNKELKKDPADYYKNIPDLFSWHDYLGLALPTAEDIRALIKELRDRKIEAVEELIGNHIGGDFGELYTALCHFDDRLPKNLRELDIPASSLF